MNWLYTLDFSVNIILWYGFTVLSTIYSKKYLNATHDAHTLTLITFLYAALLKISRTNGLSELAQLLRNHEYFCLGLFNIGTILLTNIGMNETTVSLTYMVKASEPLFVLIMSYYILEESQELKVRLTLIPICLGVTLIVCGEMSLNLLGFTCAFAANISSASRIVFYKSKLKDSSSSSLSNGTTKSSSSSSSSTVSAFGTYLNVGFVSFCLYLPAYVLQILIDLIRRATTDQNLTGFLDTKLSNSFVSALEFLIYGSLFNFAYNLFSLRVLANVAPISHSVINIMKRVFIVFCSMAVFSTRITSLQWLGMLCADLGVFLYSCLKMKSQIVKVNVSMERKSTYKKLIVYSVVFFVIASCFMGTSTKNVVDSNSVRKFSEKEINEKRIKCITDIKNDLTSIARALIPSDRPAHLLDIPQHRNYGDTLIWIGEEILLEELKINVIHRVLSYDRRLFSIDYLRSKISPTDTILLHGGGNFGDLYRFHVKLRNFVIENFPNNTIVILPQTINYSNKKLAINDSLVYASAAKLSIMTRSFESFAFAKEYFTSVNNVLVPDAAFAIGPVAPAREPDVDILVLRRIDKEKQFSLDVWLAYMRKIIGEKYTYRIRDWFDYKDATKRSMDELASGRLDLVNQIISQGKLVITDRLHASIMSVLLGKPHVIINEKYNKILNTRRAAFEGRPECSSDFIRGYYADDIEQAVLIAQAMLDGTFSPPQNPSFN